MRSAPRRLASLLAMLLVAHLTAGSALARCLPTATGGHPGVSPAGHGGDRHAAGAETRGPRAAAADDVAHGRLPEGERAVPPHCFGATSCQSGILPPTDGSAAPRRVAATVRPAADEGVAPRAAPAPEPPPPRA